MSIRQPQFQGPDSGDSFDFPKNGYSGDGHPNGELVVHLNPSVNEHKNTALASANQIRSDHLDVRCLDGYKDQGSEPVLAGLPGSERLQFSSSPVHSAASSAPTLMTKPTPSTESWKLACLVFIFLVWVSTASALIFLYMDRYLFG